MINLAKLPLRGRKACLSRKYWVARGIALDSGWVASLTGEREVGRVGLYQVVCGTVLHFFLKRQLMTNKNLSFDTGFIAIWLLVIKDN